MQNLNELVKLYKETKDKKLIEQIFTLLKGVIKKKAEYTYYQKKFKVSKNKYIKLLENNQTTLDDVKQELYLDILKWINGYIEDKGFDVYLFSRLWYWHPSFVTRDFLNQYNTVSIYKVDDEGNEDNLIEHIAISNELENRIDIDDLFNNLTTQEKLVINILVKNQTATDLQIAEIIGVSRQRVTHILMAIRKKFKKHVAL
jgi:hypothetical protein